MGFKEKERIEKEKNSNTAFGLFTTGIILLCLSPFIFSKKSPYFSSYKKDNFPKHHISQIDSSNKRILDSLTSDLEARKIVGIEIQNPDGSYTSVHKKYMITYESDDSVYTPFGTFVRKK